MITTQLSRYPGVRPFSTQERISFFGRESEVGRLTSLVSLEGITVLSGRSGYGKSSLVNAGLLPRLEEDRWEQHNFRFGPYVSDAVQGGLLDQMQEILQQNSLTSWLNDWAAHHDIKPGLWHWLKNLEIQREAGHWQRLLVFDQFEEVFTWPKEHLEALKNDLAEVSYENTPSRYLNALNKTDFNLPETHMRQLLSPLRTHILFIIRSDRLSLLDRLSDRIPNTLRNILEIKPLGPSQARAALELPARQQGDFDTPPYAFAPEAMDILLDRLSNDQNEIEPFQLQIIGQTIEHHVKASGNLMIRPEDLPDSASTLANYYENALRMLPTEEQMIGRRVIEEGLLFEDASGGARRLSMYEGVLQQSFGISGDLLKRLTNVFLLRSEPNISGGYNYEISHDTLLPAILDAKYKRKEREARAHLAVALEEEQQSRLALSEIINKKSQRTKILFFVSFILNVILLFLLFLLLFRH